MRFSNSCKKRFFYVGNFFSDSMRIERGIFTDSPAATQKITEISLSIRGAGERIWLISLGRGQSNLPFQYFSARAGRIRGVPVIYLPFIKTPTITHLFTLFALFLQVVLITNQKSVVIYYNYLQHYLLSIISLRLLGRRFIIDIEDGYRQDEGGLKSKVEKFLLSFYCWLSKDRVMMASTNILNKKLTQKPFICYGVSPPRILKDKWDKAPLKVLLGGSLLPDTGSDLFIKALQLYNSKYLKESHQIKFIVTGFGEASERLRNLANGELKGILTFYGIVTDAEYSAIANDCHIGLCLKIPSRSMGDTTFPSKAIDLVSRGLLLISTKVSDIPLIFDSESAILLDQPTPENLLDAVVWVSNNCNNSKLIALRGTHKINALLSPLNVGNKLIEFWQGNGSNNQLFTK